MNETQLTELADQVADILATKENEANNATLVRIGQATVVAGVVYVGIRLAQNVALRYKIRKLEKKKA